LIHNEITLVSATHAYGVQIGSGTHPSFLTWWVPWILMKWPARGTEQSHTEISTATIAGLRTVVRIKNKRIW